MLIGFLPRQSYGCHGQEELSWSPGVSGLLTETSQVPLINSAWGLPFSAAAGSVLSSDTACPRGRAGLQDIASSLNLAFPPSSASVPGHWGPFRCFLLEDADVRSGEAAKKAQGDLEVEAWVSRGPGPREPGIARSRESAETWVQEPESANGRGQPGDGRGAESPSWGVAQGVPAEPQGWLDRCPSPAATPQVSRGRLVSEPHTTRPGSPDLPGRRWGALRAPGFPRLASPLCLCPVSLLRTFPQTCVLGGRGYGD